MAKSGIPGQKPLEGKSVMLPCKEIVRILSSQDTSANEFSFMQRAGLRLHLLMCKHCSHYATHLEMMRAGFKKLFSKIMQVDKVEVQQLEDEIIRKVSTGSQGK